jgi:hypothetical protein
MWKMIAVGPLQELDLSQFRQGAPDFFRPPAVLQHRRLLQSLVRPSVQFVNRFDSEYVRRLQRACNPNFPPEECLHAGNIG